MRTTMHTAIISLRAHFVYVVFVLSISVQYMGCNLAVNIYVVSEKQCSNSPAPKPQIRSLFDKSTKFLMGFVAHVATK